MRKIPVSDSFTRFSLFLLLALAPLPLGLVEAWSLGLFEFLVGAVFLTWLISSRIRGIMTWKASPLYLPIMVILVFFLIRLLPWGTISIPGESSFFSLRSLIPSASLNEFQQALTCAVIFILLINLSRPQDLRVFSLVFLIVAAVYSLFGLIQYNLHDYLLLGYQRTRMQMGNLSGTYINPDHFAALLEMAIPAGLGLLVFLAPGSAKAKKDDHLLSRIRQRLSQGYEHSWARYLLIGFLLIALVTSLIFTASRGGIVAGLTALIFYFLLIRSRPRRRRLPRVIIFILTLSLFTGLWIGLAPVFKKFSLTEAQLSSFNGRIPYWQAGLRIFTDHPLFGSGPETTRWAYPRYRAPESPDNVMVDHLHNDYLEFLSENGLVGLGLLLWLLLAYVRTLRNNPLPRLNSGRRSRRELLIPAFQAGILALLLHALIDFIFQVPANLFLFTAFVAFSSLGSEARPENPSYLSPSRGGDKVKTLLLFTAAVLLLAGSLRTAAGGIFYRSLDPKVHKFLRSSQIIPPEDIDLSQAARRLQLAAKLDPLNPRYRHELGQTLIRLSVSYAGLDTGWGSSRGEEILRAQAVQQFEQAVRLNPLDPRSRIALALLLFPSITPSGSARNRSYQLLFSARQLDPANGSNSLIIGNFYLQHWNELNSEEKQLGMESLKFALAKNPRVFPAVLTRAWMIIGDYRIIRQFIPDTSWHHKESSRVLRRLGAIEAAEIEAAGSQNQ